MQASDTPGDLVVVILNYCMGPLAVECLRSLESEVHGLGARVVVADNASPDGSLDVIDAAIAREGWGAWVSTLALPRNGGFAYGNNRAVERALQDPQVEFVYLLNPDTLMHAGGIARTRDYLLAHPKVGIVGARLTWPDGQLNSGPHAAPSPLGELASASRVGRLKARYGKASHLDPDAPAIECDWVSGAAFCVRREVFETVGLMDEGYFLYYEEVDFCLRAKREGWEIHYLRDARVTHMEGQATGIHSDRRRPPYWFDSRRRFFAKAYGTGGLIAADLCWTAGRALRALREGVTRSADEDAPQVTRDMLLSDAWALVRGQLPEALAEA
ncbi:MAG: glycosyltransferase family 2 protein [Planctomycetes bacterium]|nr:glycosyltransferase family 2 protein [Planctomycetota bacterium]